ncbi:cytidylyltransferase domain-containing protein [Cytobacillus sp. BC1816]|uniref:acylneuraminate cytidylyltransferase family protein n=1 Tax=Cytobacillus sp. BC1816 TaxID=3440154 RepID=UPI003F50E1F7
MSKITAFLPCRKGSQRVINKNTRPFCGIDGGLTKIKINQLINTPSINKIIVSTDDEKVKNICYEQLSKSLKEFEIIERPAHLASSTTSTDDVITYVTNVVKEESDILWTHVTSPFIDEGFYENAIEKYIKHKDEFDSLMSVTKIQKYLWDSKGSSINYDRSVEKWPPTQTLPELYEINSAIFIANIEIYKRYSDRIGIKPYLFETDENSSRDIDWEHDFKLAETQWDRTMKEQLIRE